MIKEKNSMRAPLPSRWIRYGFAISLFFSALTGFAQMPIFKRYYIADIPGLGWLAQFYTTYTLHYISATLLIALGTFLILDYILLHRKTVRVSLLGYLRAAILMFIVLTGVLLVYRNLPGYRYPPTVVVALDFSHLGLVIVFLLASLASLVARRSWVVKQKAEGTLNSKS
jgi:hypothetical protein